MATDAPGGDATEGPDEVLLARGNSVRFGGLVPIVCGTLLGVLTLATGASPRVVVPVCSVAVALIVFGVLHLMGSFEDAEPTCTVSIRDLVAPGVALVGAVMSLWLLLRAAVGGLLPVVASAIAFPVAVIACLAALHWLGARLGPWRDRKLTDRHGFWLVVLATLLYVPMLGNHSLIDPWETHYGEVAREILARNDWISLWWAQDGWFWSKPVLSFWMQALAMALTGVRYESGQMLSAVADGRMPQPEWALRMSIFPIIVIGVYLLYKAVARSHGRRAGLLGGVVLLTMPQFFLVAHQTMTDMPFVAFIAGAVGAFILAVHTERHERVKVYAVDLGFCELRLSLVHLVLGAALIVVVPQVLYLLSRNVSMATSPYFDIRFVADSFAAGSIDNCGLPGNSECEVGLRPLVQRFEPVVQALLWLQCMALALWLLWGERRTKRWLFVLAWLFASLATMTKGPAGLGFPVLAALGWIVATKRWRELTRMEIAAGVLVFVASVLPWFVAMYVRHGQPFTDRLIFHDMFKRAFRHVHDSNKGVDTSFRYYLWQLGYATFPWVGLVPVAMARWLAKRDERRFCTEVVLASWFASGFVLFALMGTKFHHYCLPIVPPLAMLTGVLLDDLMRRRTSDATAALLGAAAVAGSMLTFAVGRDLAHDVPDRYSQIRLLHLFTYNYTRPWPQTLSWSTELWVFTIGATLLTAALSWRRYRRQIVTALMALCTAFAAWGLDVYFVELSPHWGQRELFMAYEKARVIEPGQLVAYQMNWKGENFYRGNAMAAFVSSGSKFQDWVDEQKRKGQKSFYFVTEHKRVSSLERELGHPRHFDELTDERLNNKFVLLRARF